MQIPLFPLDWVVFPLQQVKLHVFEKRYLQLISQLSIGQCFAIPFYKNKAIKPIATLVRLEKQLKNSADDSVDIICQAETLVRLSEFIAPDSAHLYNRSKYEVIANDFILLDQEKKELLGSLEELFGLFSLAQYTDWALETQQSITYKVAHAIGMTKDDQYCLLELFSEHERAKFMLKHLQAIMPLVKQVEQTKLLVRQNGHFRSYNPMDF